MNWLLSQLLTTGPVRRLRNSAAGFVKSGMMAVPNPAPSTTPQEGDPSQGGKPVTPPAVDILSSSQPIPTYNASVEQIRNTAKWILTAFAAVGAILTAGATLTSFGQLEPWSERFWVALVAFIVGVAAAGGVVWSASKVLTSGDISLGDLVGTSENYNDDRNFVAGNKTLLAKHESVAKIEEVYVDVLRKQADAIRAGKDLPDSVRETIGLYGTMIEDMLAAARMNRILRVFRQQQWIMIPGAVLTGVAILIFSYAANPAKEQGEFRVPVDVRIDLGVAEQERLDGILGEDCVENTFDAILVSQGSEDSDVIAKTSDSCRMARFAVKNDLIFPALPAVIFTPTATPPPATPVAPAMATSAATTPVVPPKVTPSVPPTPASPSAWRPPRWERPRQGGTGP
jgi:hypothetical protein